MGRRRPPRLRRVPRRVGALEADLRPRRSRGPSLPSSDPASARRRAVASRACPSSRSRPSAMDALLDGLVPGLPRGGARRRSAHARRGHPALRRRDRADAHEPRAARAGERHLSRRRRASTHWRCRRRCTRSSPSRIDGLEPDGARARPERVRSREDLRRSRRSPRSPELARRRSSRCSPRSCARRSSSSSPIRARPSAASTASSRTSCATSRTRRSRKRDRKARHLAAAEFFEDLVERP